MMYVPSLPPYNPSPCYRTYFCSKVATRSIEEGTHVYVRKMDRSVSIVYYYVRTYSVLLLAVSP